jgi:hypothetical protein
VARSLGAPYVFSRLWGKVIFVGAILKSRGCLVKGLHNVVVWLLVSCFVFRVLFVKKFVIRCSESCMY